MFTLLKFKEDEILSVCRSTRIRKKNNELIAPYRNFFYPCMILCQHDELKVVNSLVKNIQNGLPKVLCDKTGLGLLENHEQSDVGKRTAATDKFVPCIEEGSKRNYCIFCNKLLTKIVRHMGTVHKNENEVRQFLCLPKRSVERRKLTNALINKANFQYNSQQLLYSGQLVVKRRPHKNEQKTEKHYIPCANCHGFFSKLNIRNHFRYCTARRMLKSKQTLSLGRRLRGSLHHKACTLLKDKIFPIIREDAYINAIQFDELLILYANEMCIKFATRTQCYSLIRNKIRKMAYFLHHVQNMDPSIENLEDVFHPKQYDNIIKAIHKMGKKDDEGVLHAPSTAQDLGTQLKIMGEILKAECIKKSNNEKFQEVENMLFLMKQGLRSAVNVGVKEAHITNMRNKEIILPSMEDISMLMNYLYENQKKYYILLKERKFSIYNWRKLCEFTLVCIQTFNRRRPGETERMIIKDFEKREIICEKTNNELYNALSSMEKEMVKKYCRFQSRGKLNKNVAVLLNKEIEKSILLIIKYRNKAGVPSRNPYIFGQPYSSRAEFDARFYRVCPLLNKASIECGAKNPRTLRTIEMRKQIATQAALLHSKFGFNTTQISNFMGHSDKIHKSIYRMPNISTEITGIGRLLEHVQGTSISTNKRNFQCLSNSNEENFQNMNSDESLWEESSSNSKSIEQISPETPFIKKRKFHEKIDINNNLYSNRYQSFHDSSQMIKSTPKKRNRCSSDLGKEFIMRRSWTPLEVEAGFRHFEPYISTSSVPSARKIRYVMEVAPELANRTEAQIRLWICNQYKKNQRN